MKIVYRKIEDLEYIRGGRSDNRYLLENFLKSKERCMELCEYSWKTARSAQSCLIGSIKRFGYSDILAVTIRENRVFVYKRK